ncbi:MAG: hypothetical protein Q9213_002946 [Squamulea squamosa]
MSPPTAKSTALFKQLVAKHPEFNATVAQFENYAQQGMQAVDPASTAYVNRDDDVRVSLSPVYPPSAVNDAIATGYGNKARAIWYAVYGYDSWRLERLRALKKRYDPNNDFAFTTLLFEYKMDNVIEEVTSELMALQDPSWEEAEKVSPGSSSLSPSSSTSSLLISSSIPSSSSKVRKDPITKNSNSLALLRVVDPEGLCPSCTTAASDQRIEQWVSRLPDDNSGDGTSGLDENDSDRLEEDLECLVPADNSKGDGHGWWDILDLDGLFQTDGEADGETSDGWEMLGEIVEPLDFV